jgi:putative transposase
VELRRYVGSTFKDLAMQKECQVIEGHLLSDHIHLLISIPPTYSVSQAIGSLKGKSAIQIARTYMGRKKSFTGHHFWARGYFVSTVGADEETIRDYIKRQENEDRRLDQLSIFEE